MAVAPPLARIAPRRTLAAGIAVLTAGVAVVLTPYLWSDAWRLSGFGPGLAQLYLWELMPFAALAVARLVRPSLSARAVIPLLVILVAANVAAELHVNASQTGDNAVLNWLPPVLTGGVALAWAADVLARPGIAGAAWVLAAVAGLGLGRALPLEDLAAVETFVLLFASIVIEALPFVVLGAAVSAALEAFVPDRVFARIASLPVRLQVPAAVLSGMAFPVCECGSVPVARRLLLRGIHPSAGLAFMLAAPIINPVVLTSTYIAFQGRGGMEMVAGRAGLGLAVALAVGIVIGRRRAEGLLRVRDEGHGHCSSHGHGSRLRTFSDHLAGDVLFMGKFVVAGGALAAAAQVLIPQSVFAGVLAGPFVGALVLMGAAFVLSLCSEADAFVAVSFVQFPVGAQLAFLVFGPVLDIKLAMLYRGTFGRGFLLRLVVVAVPVVLVGSLLAGAVIG